MNSLSFFFSSGPLIQQGSILFFFGENPFFSPFFRSGSLIFFLRGKPSLFLFSPPLRGAGG